MLLVHGARELKLLAKGLYTHHERAAVRTPGLDGRDDELADTMAELLALPTVAVVDDPSGTVEALRGLGVVGRAEFVGDNRTVLSHLREDGDLLHLYLYNFLYETGEATDVEVALPGTGAVHRIDAWTGAVHPHAGVGQDGDRTIVTVRLAPGETALLTLDRSVAAAAPSSASAPEPVAELADWAIAVESWDAGELQADHRGPRPRLRDPGGPAADGGHPARRRHPRAASVAGPGGGRRRGLRGG